MQIITHEKYKHKLWDKTVEVKDVVKVDDMLIIIYVDDDNRKYVKEIVHFEETYEILQ